MQGKLVSRFVEIELKVTDEINFPLGQVIS
jgi:hypothetical protein